LRPSEFLDTCSVPGTGGPIKVPPSSAGSGDWVPPRRPLRNNLTVSVRADVFDLGGLGLAAGEGRRLALRVRVAPLDLANERFVAVPDEVEAVLDVSRMTGFGYALRLRFEAGIAGPCMRCLADAAPDVAVDSREVHQPGSGPELESPYVNEQGGGCLLDVAAWAHDAFVLAAPTQVLCRPECLGLCQECAANLNDAGPEHHHDPPPDPRWAKLRELKLD
jgi:uncharacterized protein